MATICKRGKFFQAKIRRKGYPGLSNSFDSRLEAKQWARLIESEMDRGIFNDRSEAEQTTLFDLLKRYQEEVTPSKSGAASEESRINVLLRDPMAEYSLSNLKSKHIAEYRDRRLQFVSGSSVNRDLSALSAALNHARKEWGILIPVNPVSLVKRAKNNPGRERRLRPEEEEAIVKALTADGKRDENGSFTKGTRNPWMKPLFLLALETAMRRSDLLRLEWKYIDLERRTAHLPTSKNGHGRTIPLSTKAVQILDSLPKEPTGRVFPLTANAVKKSWQRALNSLQIDDLHFHDTRHEATSRLFEKGLQLVEVASITGHRDPRMLMRYTHLFAENLAEKLG